MSQTVGPEWSLAGFSTSTAIWGCLEVMSTLGFWMKMGGRVTFGSGSMDELDELLLLELDDLDLMASLSLISLGFSTALLILCSLSLSELILL